LELELELPIRRGTYAPLLRHPPHHVICVSCFLNEPSWSRTFIYDYFPDIANILRDMAVNTLCILLTFVEDHARISVVMDHI
jgi:hypothetical protein